jgi:hypothetical protein
MHIPTHKHNSIYLISKKLFEKQIAEKNYKNHLRSNNYEVCTAVAHCCRNILDANVFENILSEDKIGQPALWSNETVGFLSSVAYIRCQQCIFQPHVNFICTFDLEVLNFSEKMT